MLWVWIVYDTGGGAFTVAPLRAPPFEQTRRDGQKLVCFLMLLDIIIVINGGMVTMGTITLDQRCKGRNRVGGHTLLRG